MLFKPLEDANVRETESAAAFERDADGRSAQRLHGGQSGAGGGRDGDKGRRKRREPRRIASVQSNPRRSTDHEGIKRQISERSTGRRTVQEGRLSRRSLDVGESSRRRPEVWRDVDALESEIVLAYAGKSSLVAAGDFIGKVIVRLVFLNRSAESCASLHPSVGRIRRGAEGVDGLEIAIAEVSVDIAVKIVRAGAGDDVDDATGGAAVFGGVVVGDDLEFLHGLLRDGGAHAVGGIVGGVGAIDVD